VEALERSTIAADTATAIAAMSFEGLKGTTRAFDEGNTKFSLYIMCVLDKHCKEGKIPYLYSLFILLQCPPPFKEG